MKSITIATFVGVALAFPGESKEPKGHEYRAPTTFDSWSSLRSLFWADIIEGRSPCPGLNALANHGFLPRSGKNIDYDLVNEATILAYNYKNGTWFDAVQMAFTTNVSTTDTPNETFDLFDLARHDAIEMDGSLSRNDIYFGDDVHFDATVWSGVAKDLNLYDTRHEAFVTVEVAAQARAARVELAMSMNPTFNSSESQQRGTFGTTGLYLLTMWDDAAKAAPKSWLRPFFGTSIEAAADARAKFIAEEDRIPYKEGFVRPQKLKDQDRLGKMVQAVIAVDT